VVDGRNGKHGGMSSGAWMMAIVIVLCVGTLLFLIGSTLRSIHDERSPGRSLWREFGLTFALMILFFLSWIGQLIAEWQVFTDEQASHGESAKVGDFVAEFSQSTLENWQSEFLQLIWQVAGLAFLLHLGSPQSKEGDERKEEKLDRILAAVDAKNAERIIEELDRQYPRK
jgi:hypothetical protein